MAWKNVVALLCIAAAVPALRAAYVGTQEEAETNAKEVRFFLYNSPHNAKGGRQLIAADPTTLSGINPSAPLIFLIHGFLQNHECGFPQDVKDAFLTRSDHPSVITVDFAEIACSGMSPVLAPLCYPSAVSGVQTVGEELSKLLQALVAKGLTSANKVHIIGLSLGAHAAGQAGNRFKQATGQQVARITGLDPAGPSFNGGLGSSRALQRGDAVFVDAIHTDSGSLGTTQNNGDADYWPNGGKDPQPGCENASNTECSHGYAARLFMQSINGGGIVGYACQSYDAFNSGTCNRESTTSATMGLFTETHVTGKFYLHTAEPSLWSGRYTCYN